MPPRQRRATATSLTETYVHGVEWVDVKLLAILVFVLAVAVQVFGSEERRIANVLSTPRVIESPRVGAFVNRTEIADIIVALEETETTNNNFLVVEGGNRMGKSTTVAVAVAILSASRPMLLTNARASDTLESLLRRLLGLSESGLWSDIISLLPFNGHCREVVQALHHRQHTSPQPVLVVEVAEVLPEDVLRELLRLAKELADAKLGLFVFVFSPSNKLVGIGELGAISRATVVGVGDLPKDATFAYLASAFNCSDAQAEAVFELLGGHLADIVGNQLLPGFCSGRVSKDDLYAAMRRRPAGDAMWVDERLHCDVFACSCPGLCGVARRDFANESYVKSRDLLVQYRLARASLAQKVLVVDSPLVRDFMKEHCHCADRAAKRSAHAATEMLLT